MFTAAAATLRHLRTDPLLPGELLPAIWPADALRTRYVRYLEAIGELVRFLSTPAGTSTGAGTGRTGRRNRSG